MIGCSSLILAKHFNEITTVVESTLRIGGSIIDSDFLESYLGLRVESVDEVGIIRRMSEGIYDEAEYQKALVWAKEKCIIGFDEW